LQLQLSLSVPSPPATELLIIGASRDAVDDFVREMARSMQAAFGLHRCISFIRRRIEWQPIATERV
jgi:hypothetical protein